MLNRAAIITCLAIFSAPVNASDQLAISLGVNPGDYTASELVQLMQCGPSNCKQRIELIHKRRDAFNAAVEAAAADRFVTRAVTFPEE